MKYFLIIALAVYLSACSQTAKMADEYGRPKHDEPKVTVLFVLGEDTVVEVTDPKPMTGEATNDQHGRTVQFQLLDDHYSRASARWASAEDKEFKGSLVLLRTGAGRTIYILLLDTNDPWQRSKDVVVANKHIEKHQLW